MLISVRAITVMQPRFASATLAHAAAPCVCADSVHNDGERHIPYIMLFPDTVRNKISAWGNLGQLSNGMIDEQLGCGCTSAVPQLDDACGRVMSDVSSMYIQYVYELYKWNNDTALLKASYPHVKKAALWHISTCDKYGVPYKLQSESVASAQPRVCIIMLTW